MSKPWLALVLLLIVVPIASALPPEGISGQTVIDEVSEGLRQYRRETDPAQRRRWLKRLAPTKDPRVALALAEAMSDPDPEYVAATLLCQHFAPDFKPVPNFPAMNHLHAAEWWEANEADLRRRARQLPR